ncbi:MAG: GAF domain-containing protein, partial [Actinobacteria bacterium]|nr:GAF domain-containing protein [Actinomycetota bacterium]
MANPPQQPHEESAVSQERQRYRLLTEQPREVLIETDLNGRVVWVSPSVVDLLGWAPDAIHGVLARDLVHVRDQHRFEEVEADVIGEAGPQDEFRCMMHTGSGGYRAVTLSAKPLMAAAHEVGGIFLQITDTHDRDAALRALAILSHANRALVGAADETQLLQQMCDTIVEVGCYALSWYGRPVNDAEQSVQVVVNAGDQFGYLDEVRVSWGDNPLGRGPTGRVLRLGVTQVENRVSPDPDYRPWSEAADRRGLLSSIALPVVVEGHLDGALMVYADEVGA